MSSYKELLKKLNEAWKETKPARGTLPDGNYNLKLVKCNIEQNLNKPKVKKRLYRVKFQFTVIEGKYKGKNSFINNDLLYKPKGGGDGGREYFMANLDIMGIKLKTLEPKDVVSTIKTNYGIILEGRIKNTDEGFSNLWLRRLISGVEAKPEPEDEPDPTEDELDLDEELDEDESEDESEDEELSLDDSEFETEDEEDETEPEPETEPKPKRGRPKGSKNKSKAERKKETVPSDTAGSDDFDDPSGWDDEFGN